MKIAVVGGGSTYTPELVSGLARERDGSTSTSSCCRTSTPSGWKSSAGSQGGCSSAAGFSGALTLTDDLDRALDGADFVLVQIRVGGQQARLPTRRCRLRAAASARRRPAPEAWPRRCARCPWCCRSRTGCASSRRRSLDRRLHEPGRDRHAGAARCGSPRRRALQRRDRVPAHGRPDARRRARTPGRRPGRAQPPDVGAGGHARRQGRPARADREPRRRAGRHVGLPREALEELGAVPPTTCATSTPTTRCSPSSAKACRARRRWPRSSAGSSSCTATPSCGEAGAPRAARRRLLQRGRGRADRVARGGGRRGARGRRPERGHAAGARRRRRGRGAGPRLPRSHRAPRRRSRSRPSCSASSSTSPPTSASRCEAALYGDPADARKALLAHPLIGQWDIASELIELLRAASEARV